MCITTMWSYIFSISLLELHIFVTKLWRGMDTFIDIKVIKGQ